jgi:molybdate transport system regulatory protein
VKEKPRVRGGHGPRRQAVDLKPRLRLVCGGTILLGPGKADLLEAVRDSGSLRRAAAYLGMSYMRAWQLAKTMNGAFEKPLIALARGGAGHGGAALTPGGAKVLALYRAMERKCSGAVAGNAAKLKGFLKK